MTDSNEKIRSTFPLSGLPLGESACVVSVLSGMNNEGVTSVVRAGSDDCTRSDDCVGSKDGIDGEHISRRLYELGFRAGERVESVGRSPLGGMRAYRILQSVTALRDADAARVIVTNDKA